MLKKCPSRSCSWLCSWWLPQPEMDTPQNVLRADRPVPLILSLLSSSRQSSSPQHVCSLTHSACTPVVVATTTCMVVLDQPYLATIPNSHNVLCEAAQP